MLVITNTSNSLVNVHLAWEERKGRKDETPEMMVCSPWKGELRQQRMSWGPGKGMLRFISPFLESGKVCDNFNQQSKQNLRCVISEHEWLERSHLSFHINNLSTSRPPCCEEAYSHRCQLKHSRGQSWSLLHASLGTKLGNEQTFRRLQSPAAESLLAFTCYKQRPHTSSDRQAIFLCLNSWLTESVKLSK